MLAATAVEPVVEDRLEPPLSEMAYQALLGMLLSGKLAPNEIVTERQVAAQLGISRTPLREAVRRLEGERMLERQKSGAFVVRPLPLEEYVHLLAVRRLLEGEAARLAAGRIGKSVLDGLEARFKELRALPLDAELTDMRESDRDLHALIAEASGNPVLQRSIEDLRLRTAMFRFGRLPARRSTVIDEHLAIVDALAAGDGQRARRAVESHLDEVRKTLIEQLAGSFSKV